MMSDSFTLDFNENPKKYSKKRKEFLINYFSSWPCQIKVLNDKIKFKISSLKDIETFANKTLLLSDINSLIGNGDVFESILNMEAQRLMILENHKNVTNIGFELKFGKKTKRIFNDILYEFYLAWFKECHEQNKNGTMYHTQWHHFKEEMKKKLYQKYNKINGRMYQNWKEEVDDQSSLNNIILKMKNKTFQKKEL